MVMALVVAALICACAVAFRWFGYSIDRPPELSAEYSSSEALLAMEDLAGSLMAELPEEPRAGLFVSRRWETRSCYSGWNDSISWDGFVSVSVSYDFDSRTEESTGRIEYGERFAAELEDMGLNPTIERDTGRSDFSLHAERDDGLSIGYSSSYGLSLSTDCVVDDGQDVFTPPHARISPANDVQDLEGH